MHVIRRKGEAVRRALVASFAFVPCFCATQQTAIAADVENRGTGTLILAISMPVTDGKHDGYYLGIDLQICTQDGRNYTAVANSANSWLSRDKNDFLDADEGGMVLLKSLAPGQWEICGYLATATTGAMYFSPKHFYIPFTISRGRATYIGDFTAVGTMGKSLLGFAVRSGPRWVVTNRSARDVPIAQKKHPGLEPVDVSVPDVDRLGIPGFSSQDIGPSGGPRAGKLDNVAPSTMDATKTPAASAPPQ